MQAVQEEGMLGSVHAAEARSKYLENRGAVTVT